MHYLASFWNFAWRKFKIFWMVYRSAFPRVCMETIDTRLRLESICTFSHYYKILLLTKITVCNLNNLNRTGWQHDWYSRKCHCNKSNQIGLYVYQSLVNLCMNLLHIDQGHEVKIRPQLFCFSKLDSNYYNMNLIQMELGHTLKVLYGSKSVKIRCKRFIYSK